MSEQRLSRLEFSLTAVRRHNDMDEAVTVRVLSSPGSIIATLNVPCRSDGVCSCPFELRLDPDTPLERIYPEVMRQLESQYWRSV